ncbi:hypothetical protein MTR67_036144 [Solanum verrucosum]|uniref:Protein kinase domain-containing protein n=1 Tax=Solanum verrucosum TaxID=315347 RepID=A0AAF0UBH3_SOLVR|nr:hypothetical protein MTR67_036144 [Solanum verrucosum]
MLRSLELLLRWNLRLEDLHISYPVSLFFLVNCLRNVGGLVLLMVVTEEYVVGDDVFVVVDGSASYDDGVVDSGGGGGSDYIDGSGGGGSDGKGDWPGWPNGLPILTALPSHIVDVWLIGIALLELTYVTIQVSNPKEFNALIKKLKLVKKFPSRLEHLLEGTVAEKSARKMKMKKVGECFKPNLKIVKHEEEGIFSDEFEELILDCLSRNPKKRPTISELLKRPIFINVRSLKWFQMRALHAKKSRFHE